MKCPFCSKELACIAKDRRGFFLYHVGFTPSDNCEKKARKMSRKVWLKLYDRISKNGS